MAKKTLPNEVLLDLDELVRTPHYIRYKGEDHVIHEPSVESYLKILLAKRKHLRESGGVDDEYVQVQQAAGLVIDAIPTIPRDDLLKMGIAKLMLITDAIQKAGEPDEEVAEEESPNDKESENSAP
jgi:hypothetical protein